MINNNLLCVPFRMNACMRCVMSVSRSFDLFGILWFWRDMCAVALPHTRQIQLHIFLHWKKLLMLLHETLLQLFKCNCVDNNVFCFSFDFSLFLVFHLFNVFFQLGFLGSDKIHVEPYWNWIVCDIPILWYSIPHTMPNIT